MQGYGLFQFGIQVQIHYSRQMNPLKQEVTRLLAQHSQQQLLCLLRNYSRETLAPATVQISYKCFQTQIQANGKKITGYGRRAQQSLSICVKNLLDSYLSDKAFLVSMRAFLAKRDSSPLKQNEHSKSTTIQRDSEVKSRQCRQRSVTRADSRSQLHEAEARIKELQRKVRKLTEENNSLRSVVAQYRRKGNSQEVQAVPERTDEVKKRVPLLNLKCLPNYHGKSTKSINSQLLSLYEKNHGLR